MFLGVKRIVSSLKQFLKLIATGEEMVKLLHFTRKLLIHRRDREKVKGEMERWKINIQWGNLFDTVMIQYYTEMNITL